MNVTTDSPGTELRRPVWHQVVTILTVLGLVGALALLAGRQCPLVAAQTNNDAQSAQEETAMSDTATTEHTQTAKVIDVNQDTFKAEVLDSTRPVLVDFYATWCGPCQMLHPTLEKLATRYAGKATVVRVDVDKNMDLAAQYDVRAVPTLVFIKQGRELSRAMGLQPESALAKALDRAIAAG